MSQLPTFYLSHGGGPWFFLEGEFRQAHANLESYLKKDLPETLALKPRAILMISAHWEERDFTVMTHPHPPMLYDYGGFPAHTYQLQYPAPGQPQLAQEVKLLLEKSGLKTREDAQRGFDHGAFVPLAVSFPKADIPVVQLSIRSDFNPQAHLEAGRALAPLRSQGVLIIASGSSFHDLRNFGAAAKTPAKAFDEWLTETLVELSPGERTARILNWTQAPSARLAHPREEHLVPLFVALGAAEESAAHRAFHDERFLGGVTLSSYQFA